MVLANAATNAQSDNFEPQIVEQTIQQGAQSADADSSELGLNTNTQPAKPLDTGASHTLSKDRMLQRLESTFEALPGAVVILNRGGIVEQCNRQAQALLNLPLIGCAWSMIVRREFSPDDCRDGQIKLKNGKWLSLSRQSLGHDGDEVLLLADITDNRRQSRIRDRFERLSSIGEMTARLGHQIRTPLASARLYVSQLDHDDEAVRSRAAKSIEQSLLDLGNLVDDMLCFASGAKSSGEKVEIIELLHDAVNVLSPQFRPGTRLSIEANGDKIHVVGNRNALKGAVLNLVSNAHQACVDSPKIELGAMQVGEHVCITVKDNGPGIDSDICNRVFDPFFTTRPQGTGLGLAVVRSVAEVHGGEVFLESGTSGALFCLQLPAVTERCLTSDEASHE